MVSKDFVRSIAWMDLGYSLAFHAGALLLMTLLLVKAPEMGVEAANIAAEFQLLEAAASDPAPAQSTEQASVPSHEPENPAEPTPSKTETPESLPAVPVQSPPVDIPHNAKVETSHGAKHSDSLSNSKPRSRASAPAKGAREALPDYLRNPPPTYPESSRLAREEGVVTLLVDIGNSGNPTSVRLRESSGYSGLDQAAIRAVRVWKFRPAMMGGIAVASSVSIPVRFEIH
ncbi:MAG: energy transducer TonB [Chthoniobacterales bacterium]